MGNSTARKQTKIKNKLLIFLLPAVVVTILVLVLISGYLSRKSLSEMATAQLSASITNQADNIESWLKENLQNFSTVKLLIEKTQPTAGELQEIIDANYGFNKYCRDGVYLATGGGTI